jgi:hypothetical protein
MEKKDLKFGDIITNGINYWFVCRFTETEKESCPCCQRGRHRESVSVVPIIIKDGRPLYLTEMFNETDPDTIKPYWRRI